MDNNIKSLKYFFNDRAVASTETSLEQLCYVSGRDPRLWSMDLYKDLVASIVRQLSLDHSVKLLEVGCAAGFLAQGIAGECLTYTGIDIAPSAVKACKRLGLSNAEFRVADAASLPFDNGSFDRAISYDVFTNFSNFSIAEKVVSEMLRVVKPGCPVMIGSLADAEKEAGYTERVQDVVSQLDRKFGPVDLSEKGKPPVHARLMRWYVTKVLSITPSITCYSFSKQQFIEFGNRLGVETRILDIHSKNPYHSFRFNVVYRKHV